MTFKTFTDVISFSRGTGATRVNAAGLIVGVDFSATSNTIATGSKTFTLAADANVNRDWPVGSNVIAVAQAGATGSMTGVVTSYTPSTQTLVINVISVTGSGTSTDWRIGSLEMREDYDPVTLVKKGVLSEVGATNVFSFSDDFTNVAWTKSAVTVSANSTISPDGSSNADKIIPDATTNEHFLARNLTTGLEYSIKLFVKVGGYSFIRVADGGGGLFKIDIATGQITVIDAAFGSQTISLVPYPNGWYLLSFRKTIANAQIRFFPTLDGERITAGDGTSGVFFYGLQAEVASSPTSYIPTTTAQVTRNADSFPLTATALTAIKQGTGTLYAEIDCPDTGVAQKRALRLTGTNADIRIGKDGTGTVSNFSKMVEGAGVRLMGTAASLISCDGRESLATSVISTDTGTLVTNGVTNAVAFNGADTFGRVSSVEESTIDSAITTRQLRGLGGAAINGAHFNGLSFIAATGSSGRVLKSDGSSYRCINTPVITQPTNEITSGTVAATLRNVIVGNTGFIATSDDNGETWTARTSGTTTSFTAVAFGGGTFVALNGTAANTKYSTDGITWTSSTGLTGTPTDIVYTGSQFVAINSIGGVFTSTNGITFTAVTTTGITPAFTTATGVDFNNGFYVIVGNSGQVAISQTAAGASPTTWTTFVTAQTGTAVQFNEVLTFANKFYAVGATQTVIEFTQSLTPTWTTKTANVSSTLIGIAASGTRLLICGSAGAIATSEDGTTFTSRTNNTSVLNGIAFGNNTFVSVGNSANGSGYIATIGADGTVTRRVSGVTNNLNNVKFLNGQFVATVNTTTIVTSTDGITWTSRSTNSPVGVIPTDVAFGNSIYVAVNALANSRVATSTDSITWTVATTNISAQIFNGIDFANGIFVAVGNAGAINTTVNGTTWTLRTSGTTVSLRSVMYSTRDSLWYAAGDSGVLLYSPDAITWTAVQNSGTASVFSTSLQATQQLPVFKSGTNKIALSYTANSVQAALNGVTTPIDTTATIPNITAASLGENLNGYLQKIEISPVAFSTAELTAKTL